MALTIMQIAKSPKSADFHMVVVWNVFAGPSRKDK